MLTPHTLLLSLSSSPAARPYSPPTSRPALADSTNVKSHSNPCDPGYQKCSAYPTSSARTGCGLSDFEPSIGSISASLRSPHRHVSSTSSPFSVTCKAPPTVSISLSAACSQNIPGKRFGGPRSQGLEPDLPDVRSVVPFPSTSLDMDVDMLDGTCAPCPDDHSPLVCTAPRKRRSAHSSVSSSPGSPAKDVKQKRPRKSRRHVAELWWLGVVHRSILRAMEGRQPDASERLPSGQCELCAMDCALIERIQKRLVENGCFEGRALPNLLPRISTSSISVPCLSLVTPKDLTSSTSSFEARPQGRSNYNGTAAFVPTCELPHPSPIFTSRRRHVRFGIPQLHGQSRTLPSVPRRSPSPPARMGSGPTNGQTLTLTMPQLVASLTLAYRERGGLRLKGRGDRAECGRDAGHSPHVGPYQATRCGDGNGNMMCQKSLGRRTRLSNAPERNSPLSRVAYTES